MKKNYTRIIREEINRLILEAVNVSSLSKYVQPLKKCNTDITNIGTTSNKEIDKFLSDLCMYIIQIIAGINRCVTANSLNEGLQDYGIEFPAELGGNFPNDFERNFYQGSNWVNRRFGGNGRSGSGYGNVKGNTNPNSVPSVKLEESLRNLPQISLRYQDLTNKYQNIMSQYSGVIYNTLTCISNLNTEFRQLKTNAQGTNP
jgi:hypothetical protein